jgi:hypothetical protein
VARLGGQVDVICRASDHSRNRRWIEIAFKHDFADGSVVDARFQMTWLAPHIFQVAVAGAPLGHGYVFGRYCHYHLETGKTFVEASYRWDADGNYIAWKEILRRKT